jgi:hypothetical protein
VGYATTMMKKTGRAMRLDINHRRSKILTLSKGTSASALSMKYVQTYKNQSPSPLDKTGVVRDVVNTFILRIPGSQSIRIFLATLEGRAVTNFCPVCGSRLEQRKLTFFFEGQARETSLSSCLICDPIRDAPPVRRKEDSPSRDRFDNGIRLL